MAVQIHYYGSVFDLDTKNPDEFWLGYLQNCIGEIGAHADEPRGIYLALEGGNEAHLPYAPGDRLVIVTPRGTHDQVLARALRAYEGSES